MRAPLPGAIGVSHLRVYDSAGPDGLRGGTPHLHTACTEAYAVVAGHGSVETLSSDGWSSVPLSRGAFVWFTPGTVHRLINTDGELEIFVIMQNSGLPEAGDLVCSFPSDVLEDPVRYRAAAELPAAGTDDAARLRRDLAVTGFGEWRRAVEVSGPSALRVLHAHAATLVSDRVDAFRSVVSGGAAVAVSDTLTQLTALSTWSPAHLANAAVYSYETPPEPRRFGCCGMLGTFVP